MTKFFPVAVLAAMLSIGFPSVSVAAPQDPLDKEEIAKLQKCLNVRGFNVGTPDGVAGPRTVEAVKNMERQLAKILGKPVPVTGAIIRQNYVGCAMMDFAKGREKRKKEDKSRTRNGKLSINFDGTPSTLHWRSTYKTLNAQLHLIVETSHFVERAKRLNKAEKGKKNCVRDGSLKLSEVEANRDKLGVDCTFENLRIGSQISPATVPQRIDVETLIVHCEKGKTEQTMPVQLSYKAKEIEENDGVPTKFHGSISGLGGVCSGSGARGYVTDVSLGKIRKATNTGKRKKANGPPPYSVQNLQECLNALEINVGKADGIAGAKTTAGIKNLQRLAKVSVTGEVNKATYQLCIDQHFKRTSKG